MDRYTLIIAVISFFALIQRLLREDVKCFPTLVAPWRGLVIAALQLVVAPTLDAVLNNANFAQALVTGLIAIVPTVLNVVGGIVSNKQARAAASHAAIKFGAAAALIVGVGGLGGCAAFRGAMADVKEWAKTADTFEKDAQAKLNALHDEVSAALAVLPDVPDDVKARIEQAFASANTALAAAIVATANIDSITDEAALLNVFGGFVKAWDVLQDVVTPFLAKASTKLAAAPQAAEPRVVALAHRRGAK